MGGWEKITDAKVTIVDSPRGDLSEEDARPSLVILIREEVPIFESGIEDMKLDHINEEPLISPLPFVSQTTQQPQNSAQPPKFKPIVETLKQPDHLSIGLLHLEPQAAPLLASGSSSRKEVDQAGISLFIPFWTKP